MKSATLALFAVLLLALAGCGTSESQTTAPQWAQAQQRRERATQRVARRRARRQAARRRRRAAARQARRQEAAARLATEEALAAEESEEIAAEEEAAAECDPNYSGACLDPTASDYDCEGGSGDGPYYTGEVTVVGADPYGLDADGDGIGCEAE